MLTVPRPDVDRMEYAFELQHAGRRQRVGRPTRATPSGSRGAFGDKSVLLMPEYVAAGVDRRRPAAPGHRRELALASRGLRPRRAGRAVVGAGSRPTTSRRRCSSSTTGRSTTTSPGLTLFLDAMVEQGGCRRCGPRCWRRSTATRPTARRRPTAGRWRSAWSPGCAATAPTTARARHGREPRRSRHAAGAARAPGRLRRALPAVEQLLPPACLDEQESGFARFPRITSFVDGVLRAGPADGPRAGRACPAG